MSTVRKRVGQKTSQQSKSGNGWMTFVFGSPILWGGLFTVGFYSALPYLPIQQELLVRYFCSHPLEYATALLFFVGMATLALKAFRMLTERAPFNLPLGIDAATSQKRMDVIERIAVIEDFLSALPRSLRTTHLVRRLDDVCGYVRSRRGGDGLEDHLKYLAELAAEKLHGSYALVRTITWAVPILGFLGTVIGITLAIANVTPEQLDTSLSEVTGGLAVAFDTTALALALSMVLVFSTFAVERAEQGILLRVEEFGIEQIACLFPETSRTADDLTSAQNQASQQLIEQTETMIRWQTDVWQESLSGLRQRWTETLDRQQSSLADSLQEGTSATLSDHATQLAEIRRELRDSFQATADAIAENMSAAREFEQQQQTLVLQQMTQLWDRMHAEAQTLQGSLRQELQTAVQSFAAEMAGWRTDLAALNQSLEEQSGAMHRQGEILVQLGGQESQLVRLQTRLTDNLQAIQAADAFEETMHSLSAAVHLLTARVKPGMTRPVPTSESASNGDKVDDSQAAA